MVYGTSTVNGFDPARRRWPKAWLDVLDDQLIGLLKDDGPQSIRHCFYRLTDPRLPVHVPKTEREGYRRIQRRLTRLRRDKRVPYDHLVDTTRAGYHVDTYGGAGDFLARTAGLYRHHLWAQADVHVEVWCESASIAGVLRGTCRELAVSLYPTRGFTSLTLAYEAAEEINRAGADRAVVVYVGDYDPAGVLIDQSLEAELKTHLQVPLEMRRVAINEDQITEYDLPTKPRKRGERRRPDVAATVEAEAMPASILRRMVRNAVEAYLPSGALLAAKEAEASERAVLMRLARSA